MKTRRTRVKRLWISYSRFTLVPPRLIQLCLQARCLLLGHNWSDWTTDDWDGPMSPDGEFPLIRRYAYDGEEAIRRCQNDCGLLEYRFQETGVK